MKDKNAIKALIIFNKETEVPYINYIASKDFNINPLDTVRFLKTVQMFSKYIGNSDVKMIEVEKFRLLFSETQDIIFAIITTKLINPFESLFRLNTIMTLFLNEFSEVQLNDKQKFHNDFSTFEIKVQEIIHGETIVLEKKLEIKRILEKFNENEHILGCAILSFSGDILVNALHNKEVYLIDSIFNSIYEMKISGIMKVFIEFLNLNFFSSKINDEIVLVAISKKGLSLANFESEIEEVKSKIQTVI
ncbi:MAG: hypothetical protein ACTSRG_24480 [Candidatus Helarchaeota archaeon]